MQLSKEQNTAVTFPTHNAICAIPGSGKTRVITEKVKHLYQQGHRYILVLSFTKASSIEVLGRIEQAIGQQSTDVVHVSTFHKLLFDHLFAHGFGEQFVDGRQQLDILHRLCVEHGAGRLDAGLLLDFIGTSDKDISAQKKSLERDVKFSAPSERAKAKQLLDAFLLNVKIRTAYVKYLAEHKLYTLDNLIGYAVNLQISGKLPLFQINHLFIDEFQDADKEQVAFAVLHGQAGVVVTVVGDDDQSIYKFRDAMGYAGFQFLQQHLGAHILTLSTNYRSKQEILSAAFQVVEQNQARIVKYPVAHQGAGGAVHYQLFASMEDEMDYAIEHIRLCPNKPTFIITRTNQYLDMVEKHFKEHKVPCTRIGKPHPFDTTTIHQLCSILQNMANPNVSSLMHDGHVLMPSIPLQFFHLQSVYGKTLPSQDTQAYQHFRNIVCAFRNKQVTDALSIFFQTLCSRLTDKKDVYVVDRFARQLQSIPGTLTQRLMLVMKLREEEQQEKVLLMTMHGSKGLEAERVFVMGNNLNHSPSKRAISDYGVAGLEEERRLIFVAMTRAEQELHMTAQLTPEGVKPARKPSEVFALLYDQ